METLCLALGEGGPARSRARSDGRGNGRFSDTIITRRSYSRMTKQNRQSIHSDGALRNVKSLGFILCVTHVRWTRCRWVVLVRRLGRSCPRSTAFRWSPRSPRSRLTPLPINNKSQNNTRSLCHAPPAGGARGAPRLRRDSDRIGAVKGRTLPLVLCPPGPSVCGLIAFVSCSPGPRGVCVSVKQQQTTGPRPDTYS